MDFEEKNKDESQDFEKTLVDGDLEQLNKLKSFLFRENIRIAIELQKIELQKRELEEMNQDINERKEKMIREKADFRDEMNSLNHRLTEERQRLKQDQMFFDKKMDILKNGFAELEADRKKLAREKERISIEREMMSDSNSRYGSDIMDTLFKGVDSMLSLKKRYRELIKIYHPDNSAGDNDLFKSITKEYNRLVEKYNRTGVV